MKYHVRIWNMSASYIEHHEADSVDEASEVARKLWAARFSPADARGFNFTARPDCDCGKDESE